MAAFDHKKAHMHDTGACMGCLRKDTFCNNGGYEACSGHFKLTMNNLFLARSTKGLHSFSFLE